MSNSVWIVLLSFLVGVSIHVMLRLYFPWKNKHQPLFWVTVFGGLILSQMLPLPFQVANLFLMPLFTGLIASEWARPKINAFQTNLKKKAAGQHPITKPSTKAPPKKPK